MLGGGGGGGGGGVLCDIPHQKKKAGLLLRDQT